MIDFFAVMYLDFFKFSYCFLHADAFTFGKSSESESILIYIKKNLPKLKKYKCTTIDTNLRYSMQKETHFKKCE